MTEPLIIVGNVEASKAGINTIRIAIGTNTKTTFDPFMGHSDLQSETHAKVVPTNLIKKPRSLIQGSETLNI